MALGNVVTTEGEISGVEVGDAAIPVTLFRGVPYAAPPLGERRWLPPADPEPWAGVRACDTYAPAAIQQYHSDWFRREGYFPGHYDRNPPISEDCLYLNVATAAEGPGEGRPVYIWFHTGGLTNGSSAEVTYDPVELAKKGVVVVSVGQRLGAFGYLALPQLTAERGTSGNYGLMDGLKALEWVAANAEAFGGDPDSITIGGQSGGSQKIAALVATPSSGGRIRRVISQSGLNWLRAFSTPDEAEARGVEFLRAMGVDPGAPLDELRRLPAEALNRDVVRDLLPQTMVFDGDLLPFPSMKGPLIDSVRGVDFLSGTTLGEADVLVPSIHSTRSAPDRSGPITSAAEFTAHFRRLLGDLYDEHDFGSLVEVTDATAWPTALRLGSLGLTGARGTNISRNLMVNRIFGVTVAGTGTGGSTYSYLWSHRVPPRQGDQGTDRDPSIPGVWHGADLFYTFRTVESDAWPDRRWTDRDRELADVASSYFANFMRTGNPNGPGLPSWPSSNDDYGWIEIGDTVQAHSGLDSRLELLVAAFVEREYGLRLPSAVRSSVAGRRGTAA